MLEQKKSELLLQQLGDKYNEAGGDDWDEEKESTVEDETVVLGWGTDYTHYFIGFVLLYVCVGRVAK